LVQSTNSVLLQAAAVSDFYISFHLRSLASEIKKKLRSL